MKEKRIIFNKALNISHEIVALKVHEGDSVVDATMGNGNDTLMFSKIVGAKGKVYAFDIQQKALENSKRLLRENHAEDNVAFIHAGHENVDQYVKVKVSLVLFNLGYLPQADRTITTKVDSTLTAIEKSLNLLVEGGLVLVVIYPGHEEGMREKEKIHEFASRLHQNKYHVFSINLINQVNNPPEIIGIEKNIDE